MRRQHTCEGENKRQACVCEDNKPVKVKTRDRHQRAKTYTCEGENKKQASACEDNTPVKVKTRDRHQCGESWI